MISKVNQILIADKHYLIREGLKRLIQTQEGFSLAGECAQKEDLFSTLLAKKIDILIIDFNQLENFAVSDLSLISILSPDTKVVIISDVDDQQVAHQVVEMGVYGFLTKTCDSKEILDCLAATIRNEKLYCYKVVDLLMGVKKQQVENCNPTILSEREIEVVKLIASGFTTKQIAKSLYRSFHTISTHRKNIMKKLGFKSTSELMVYAMNAGIILPENNQSAFQN